MGVEGIEGGGGGMESRDKTCCQNGCHLAIYSHSWLLAHTMNTLQEDKSQLGKVKGKTSALSQNEVLSHKS